MGYTHYFERETFKNFAADVRKLFKAAAKRKEKIFLANGQGDVGTKPQANIDGVIFNGMDFSEQPGGQDGSHETLHIQRVITPKNWEKIDENELLFKFCKTARKPYDIVVVAVLIALKKHFPIVQISSDGNQKDWKEGVEFCQKVLGYGETFNIDATKDSGDFED